jgi:hypothetical protein
MDHFGSAKLMISFHAQFMKRTKTLIFDRDLPEEESIQTADQYQENFKVLYCKIKRCDKALNALPESERETWTAAKCVSDESHRITILEGTRYLKYQSNVSHLEEAKKDLHAIMKEVINLHIAECIKMNENVVWGVGSGEWLTLLFTRSLDELASEGGTNKINHIETLQCQHTCFGYRE